MLGNWPIGIWHVRYLAYRYLAYRYLALWNVYPNWKKLTESYEQNYLFGPNEHHPAVLTDVFLGKKSSNHDKYQHSDIHSAILLSVIAGRAVT